MGAEFRMTIENVVGALKFPQWYSQRRIAELAASRTQFQSLPFRTWNICLIERRQWIPTRRTAASRRATQFATCRHFRKILFFIFDGQQCVGLFFAMSLIFARCLDFKLRCIDLDAHNNKWATMQRSGKHNLAI